MAVTQNLLQAPDQLCTVSAGVDLQYLCVFALIGKYREAKDKTALHQQIKTDSKAQVTVKTLPVFVCSPNNVVDLALIALNLPI